MDMRDIAKLAGVSSATVSRVINSSGTVRPETAEKVRRVIDKLKFVPNGSAATLKYGRSNTYGLIIPDITNPFFPEFIECFEEILADTDYNMMMATTASRTSKVSQTIQRMLVRQVEGIALLASEIETEPIESMMKNRVPLVTMDRRLVGRGVSDVSVGNTSGMRQAIGHLSELRHRKIAYIGGSIGPTISDHRMNSFVRTMQEFTLPVDPQFLRSGNYRISGGEKAMAELISLRNRPTAIIAANDLTAIGALRSIHREGLRVPGDFSIVGFDNIELSDMIDPPLTTLHLPRYELAKKFVNALTEFALDPHKAGKQYRLETKLVLRSSTGPVRRPIKNR